MTGCLFGTSEKDLEGRLEARGTSRDALLAAGVVVGAGDGFVRQLGALADAGCARVMLQWIDLDDTVRLSDMADLVLPVFNRK